MNLLKAIYRLVGFCALATATVSADTNSNLVFSWATVEAGTAILTNRDDFISNLSAFDRSARMKVAHDITEQEYLGFLAKNVEAWTADESNKLAGALSDVQKQIAPWASLLPKPVCLIKTSGREEGQACYTRKNAIVIPRHELRGTPANLQSMITHELFHVLSRHNPELRTNLYRSIGFTAISAIQYPEELRQRRITNPDGVNNGWAINVKENGRDLTVIQVLYASTPHYDTARGGEFFNYLVFKLLAVEPNGDRWQPKLVNGHPELLDADAVQGFYEKIGRNTDYIVHPDEILAVNFVHLVNGNTNLASPKVVADMRKILSKSGP